MGRRIYRFAVLNESLSGVVSAAVDLRSGTADAASRAAEVDETVNVLAFFGCRLHLSHVCLQGGGRMRMVTVFVSATTRPDAAQTSTTGVIIFVMLS